MNDMPFTCPWLESVMLRGDGSPSRPQSTGLRRAVLCLDLASTLNRIELTREPDEMALLDAEQLTLYADTLDVPGDHPVFQQIAALIGQKAIP